MFPFTLLVSLTLLPFTIAQSGNDTALGIAAMEAHFKQSEIVPELLTSFNPSALLTVNFPGVGDITPGQALTEQQSASAPTVTVTAANSSVSLDGNYTIMMVDADVVGSDLSNGENHHWLVNGVKISDGTLSNASATPIVSYAGPGPAAGSGPHRYVILLYVQPDNFTAPADLSKPTGVSMFNLSEYVQDSGLGPLLAANYMTVEDGTATVSIPATSSVISSTLVPVFTTTSSGKAASGTSTSGAAKTTSNSASFVTSFSPLRLLLTGFAVAFVA
ncbi:hypothetical protein H0H92_003915 [Tricholoma furcatifolium]|nr:hypothetical protein H0H92_003915 [Tricholoma furcatifolium]